MADGVFEKMSGSMVLIVIGVFGLIMYSNNLFTKYSITSNAANQFDAINKVNELNQSLNIMYVNNSQSQSFLNFIGDGTVLAAGWQIVSLIPNIIGLFLTLPYQLMVIIIPYDGTGVNYGAWIGGLLNVVYLTVIVFGLTNIALSRSPKST